MLDVSHLPNAAFHATTQMMSKMDVALGSMK